MNAIPSGKKARVTMRPGFAQKVTAHVERQLDKAATYAKNYMRELVAEGYPPASEPGTPPHVRSGDLRRAIDFDQVQPLKRRIGLQGADETVMHYGVILECGSRPHQVTHTVQPTVALRKTGTGRIRGGKNRAWYVMKGYTSTYLHPGMLPRPYIRRTIWDVGSEIQILITKPMRN